jgi:hypothetical protein
VNRAWWDITNKEIPLRASPVRATFGSGSRYPQSVSSAGLQHSFTFDLCDLTQFCFEYMLFLSRMLRRHRRSRSEFLFIFGSAPPGHGVSSETAGEKVNIAMSPSVSYRVVRLRRMTSLGIPWLTHTFRDKQSSKSPVKK